MVFNSLTFLLFFSVVLSLYRLPLPWRMHKTILLIASYLFYGAWSPPFLLLLIFSTTVDWLAARRMERARGRAARRAYLAVSLLSNLGLLAYFKYGGFLLQNFTALVNSQGISYSPPTPGIVLPVGISFYTFQALSYTIDIYRGRLRVAASLLDFSLFVAFFPQLVAGPIMRAGDFLPQLSARRRVTSDQLGWGLTLLFVGLFEKVVVADTLLAPVADQAFFAAADLGFGNAWAGTLAFSAQIFFDFAGYSTCAVGAALCFGFTLMKNFNYPYAAVGFAEFWRRWHVSLSEWLRDYVFSSLPGSPRKRRNLYWQVVVTMLVAGLWHGPAWKFIAWGGLHGLYLVAERIIKTLFKKRQAGPRGPALSSATATEDALAHPAGRVLRPALALLTFVLISVAWVLFRARDLASARAMLTAMAGNREGFMPVGGGAFTALVIVALTLAAHWKMRDADLADVAARIPVWLRPVILAFIVVSILVTLVSGDNRAFIYFQF